MRKQNKKGQATVGWLLALVGIAFLGIFVWVAVQQGLFSKPEAGVGQSVTTQTATQVAQATKSGDIATVGVYVRNLADDDTNRKIPIATYCVDSTGTFVIDGTTSSQTAEITGKTSIGETITCYAFDSSHQTLEPEVITVDGEYEHVIVDAYNVSLGGELTYYTETLSVSTNNVDYGTNISVPASSTATLNKMRYKNNETNKWQPVGGFYFNALANSTITKVKLNSPLTISGNSENSGADIVASTLPINVIARKQLWDFAFELDDDSATAGNQVVILEGNDYLDTGTVEVSADGSGCSATGGAGLFSDVINGYRFMKGYYREAVGDGIGYGHETDALTPARVLTDMLGHSFKCNA